MSSGGENYISGNDGKKLVILLKMMVVRMMIMVVVMMPVMMRKTEMTMMNSRQSLTMVFSMGRLDGHIQI